MRRDENRSVRLLGSEQLRGEVLGVEDVRDHREAIIRLEDGTTLRIQGEVARDAAGLFYLPVLLTTPAVPRAPADDRIPVAHEELLVSKRVRESGRVRIDVHVHEREETVELPRVSDEIEVERVPINRVVDAPVGMRTENEVVIIPVLEEVHIVEKRLLLKEELRIRHRRRQTWKTQRIRLRREEAVVSRRPPDESET